MRFPLPLAFLTAYSLALYRRRSVLAGVHRRAAAARCWLATCSLQLPAHRALATGQHRAQTITDACSLHLPSRPRDVGVLLIEFSNEKTDSQRSREVSKVTKPSGVSLRYKLRQMHC